MKKLLVVGVIVLFLGLTIAPSINADVDRVLSKSITNQVLEESEDIIISKYKSDGTIERKTIEISKNKLKDMEDRLLTVDCIEDRFDIYKEYGLIPKDVTCDALKREMEEKAKRLGLTQEILDRISNSAMKPHMGDLDAIIINCLCSVNAEFSESFFPCFGLSFFTSRINLLLNILSIVLQINISLIPSIDVLNIYYGHRGDIYTNDGIFHNHFEVHHAPSFSVIIGFVGYSYMIPYSYYKFPYYYREIVVDGYSCLVFGIGRPYAAP